jgi:hypothetical protein
MDTIIAWGVHAPVVILGAWRLALRFQYNVAHLFSAYKESFIIGKY